MDDSVILKLPLALLLYTAALFLCVYDLRYKGTRGACTVLSAILVVAATGYSLLMGASLAEGSTALLAFLLMNMGVKE